MPPAESAFPSTNTHFDQLDKMSTMQAAADARKAKIAALKKRKTMHDSADSQTSNPQS